MRWKSKEIKSPKRGEVRRRNIFALFPITLNNVTCWLENVDIEETWYVAMDQYDHDHWGLTKILDKKGNKK